MNFVTRWRRKRHIRKYILLMFAHEKLTESKSDYHEYMQQAFRASSLLEELRWEQRADGELESTIEILRMAGLPIRQDILEEQCDEMMDSAMIGGDE